MPHAPRSTPSIFALWWPLAASSVLMSAEIPFINSGIARTADPEIALAAFGLATSFAFLSEAPITMLTSTTAALAKDRATVRVLQRFTIYLAIFAASVHFLLSFTPLYGMILRQWMGVPEAVAAATVPILRFYVLWAAFIGWRRFHQGLLIRMRRTNLISVATIARLCLTVALTLVTINVLRMPGEVAGSISIVSAVTSESLLIMYWARHILETDLDDTAREPSVTYSQLFQFYLPLVMVAAMNILGGPLISTGLSRAPFPTQSLATWPTVWGLTMLVGGLCQPIQETTIASLERVDTGRAIRRFGIAVGLIASALLALVALTPLADLYFGQLIGLSSDLRAFADPAIRLMCGYPLWIGIEMMLRGFLIKHKHTAGVRLAMIANFVTLATALLCGVALNLGTGIQVAAVGINLAIGAEIAILAWQALPIAQSLRRAVATT